MSLPPNQDEWRQLAASGGFATFEPEPPGHLVVVSQPGLIQAQCVCGWWGPDRTDDPHAGPLVIDDVCWHSHEIGSRCPEQQACLTCTPEAWT